MTCPDSTPCIEGIAEPATGNVSYSPVASVAPENDFLCLTTGAFVPKSLQVVNCTTSEASAADGVPGGLLLVVAMSDSLTLTNPTTDRVMHCIVQIQFGAVRMACTQQGVPAVEDRFQFGVAGTLTPAGFLPLGYDYRIGDGNISDPEARTIIEIPGRSVPFVVCPELGPGVSLEVQVQRLYSTNGISTGLNDFLLQPTNIQAWGIVV